MKSAGVCLTSVHVHEVLSVCFDVRKHWEDESGKKGDRFTVENMVGTGPGTDHEMLIKRATVVYDTLFWKPKGQTEVWKPKGQTEVERIVYAHRYHALRIVICQVTSDKQVWRPSAARAAAKPVHLQAPTTPTYQPAKRGLEEGGSKGKGKGKGKGKWVSMR